MIIRKLTIENIRSYKFSEIVFPKGSILLSGDIGSGKTTLLLAIEFALFGLQPGQKGASLLRNGEDHARVILEFEVDDKEIMIERTLKRERRSITQDYTSITINNERFAESVTEIKNRILSLLNYPQEFSKKTNLLYKFTVYTPQEEMKQIILEPGEIRLNTLRHVFGIDKYKRIEENSIILTSRLREKIKLNEGMSYGLENDKTALTKLKDDLIGCKERQKISSEEYNHSLKKTEEKEKDIKEVQAKIEEKKALENEKSKLNILASEKKQQLVIQDKTLISLKAQIDEASQMKFRPDEYISILERISYQEKKEEELQKEYIDLVSKIKAQEIKKREAEILNQKIMGLNSCPTCLQDVSKEYKDNILSKIDNDINEIRATLNTLVSSKNQVLEKIEPTKKVKEELKTKKSELELKKVKLENIKEKEARVIEINQQKSILEKDIGKIEKHLISIEVLVKQFVQYETIHKERENELKILKQNDNMLAIRTAELNKEVQFIEEKIKDKKDLIESKELVKSSTEKMRKLENWVSTKFIELVLFTEKQVMITLREEFSRLFSKWFSILVSDTLSAQLDENFSPIIEHQDYDLDYGFLSGGERTAIALAYRLSLNQIINSMLSNIKTGNLVILDEPTDGFSSQQLDKMRDVLKELEVEQLIIVSHEQKIEGFVDNIVHIKKHNNLSVAD